MKFKAITVSIQPKPKTGLEDGNGQHPKETPQVSIQPKPKTGLEEWQILGGNFRHISFNPAEAEDGFRRMFI